jgi:hypothetical protein
MMQARRSLIVAALAIAIASCKDQPMAIQPAEPEFLDWAATPLFSTNASSATVSDAGTETIYLGHRHHVNLEQTRVSFWAVRGQSRSVQINYKSRRNAEPRPFLLLTTTDPRFVPDLGELAVGDSVLITVKVNTRKLLVSLEPTGLQFGEPGQLTIWYRDARGARGEQDDHDQSSANDEIDDSDLALYYREDQKHPWSQLAATQSIADKSFTYAIPHFSDYAVAKLREWAVGL